jgi:hypothetical protein
VLLAVLDPRLLELEGCGARAFGERPQTPVLEFRWSIYSTNLVHLFGQFGPSIRPTCTLLIINTHPDEIATRHPRILELEGGRARALGERPPAPAIRESRPPDMGVVTSLY